MKYLITTAMVIFSQSALACPNLVGNWLFSQSTDPNAAKNAYAIQQTKVSETVVQYSVDDKDPDGTVDHLDYITDGVARTQSSDSPAGTITISMQANCDSNALVIKLKATLDGKDIGGGTLRISTDKETTLKVLSVNSDGKENVATYSRQ